MKDKTMTFLGKPSRKINQWIIDHYKVPQVEWSTFLEKLEEFDTSKAPSAQGLPRVGASVGATCPYMICDGYLNDGGFVQCLTRDAVMSNIDKINDVNIDWVVLGYNGTVPKYIKYKNGEDRIYVSSTDDSDGEFGQLRAITSGCKVYSRSWSSTELCNKFTDTGKTVSIVSGRFTYGTTSNNCGTTATEAGGYTVPISVAVDGISYTFCGYTATLQTRYCLTSSKDGISITESTCAYNYQNEYYPYGKARWGDSFIRTFMNSRLGHDEIAYPSRWPSHETADMLNFTNGLDLKLAKATEFLKCVAPTVRRNFVAEAWRSDSDIIGKLDANGCEHTANDFFLLTNAEVNAEDSLYFKGDAVEAFARFSVAYPDRVEIGSVPTVSEHLKKYKIGNLSGNPIGFADDWWLTSAHESSSYTVASVQLPGVVHYRSFGNGSRCIAPACTLY